MPERSDLQQSEDKLSHLIGLSGDQFCRLYLQVAHAHVSEADNHAQRTAHNVYQALASRGFMGVLSKHLKACRAFAPPVKWAQDRVRTSDALSDPGTDSVITDVVLYWHSFFSQAMDSRDISNLAPVAAQAMDDGIIELLCGWSMRKNISGETGL